MTLAVAFFTSYLSYNHLKTTAWVVPVFAKWTSENFKLFLEAPLLPSIITRISSGGPFL